MRKVKTVEWMSAALLARTASRWHAGWGADLIFALVALHVLAIAWYAWRRREPCFCSSSRAQSLVFHGPSRQRATVGQ